MKSDRLLKVIMLKERERQISMCFLRAANAGIKQRKRTIKEGRVRGGRDGGREGKRAS